MFVGLMIAFAQVKRCSRRSFLDENQIEHFSSQFANLTLGQQVAAFSTVGKAFVALFRTVLGDFDYEAIRDASPITGPIFFFLCKIFSREKHRKYSFEDIFSMVFMLFNMVLVSRLKNVSSFKVRLGDYCRFVRRIRKRISTRRSSNVNRCSSVDQRCDSIFIRTFSSLEKTENFSSN